jgi:DNA gyrase/topoisomerase IV subunit A
MPKQNSSQYISRISREFGLYTLDKRAIPAMSDGLKSGQRIALWLMRNRPDKLKTMALAGQMIASELYLHGDTSAADAISMLAGPYCNNSPLFHGIGAFGTRAEPTKFSAPRYTYVKRSDLAQKALYIDLDIVPMRENHDGSTMMPSTFLPLVPLVLLNGIKGIATGWSTNVLPRKFEDIVGAVNEVLQTGKVQRTLLPHYENRDVVVIVRDDNQYTIQGRVAKKNTTTVHVTELPPDLTLEAFRQRLSEMEDEGKITSFKDRSTKTINIEIRMTRAVLGKLNDEKLIEFFKIRTLTTENLTVQGIGGSKVIQYDNAEKLVEDWVKWRLGLYLDRYQKLLADEQMTNLYWRYIMACFQGDLPSAITGLPGRKSLKENIERLGENRKLPKASDDILDRISGLPSYKWTEEGHEEAEKQVAASDKRIAEYEGLVASDRKRKTIFKKEVGALV